MSIRDRLGFDAGGMRLEDALAWAAHAGFHYVDFNADQPPNDLDTWLEDMLGGRDYLTACRPTA